MTDANAGELHLHVLAHDPQKPISESKRFVLLLTAMFGMICVSFGFAFNMVTPVLQTRFNYTQRDMVAINVVGMVFAYFMMPFGILFDYFGPVPVSVIALILFPLGCILTALCFEGVIEATVVRLCVFNAMQNIGLSIPDLVCCMTALGYFPVNRGPVIALLKTALGIGSAVVASMYTGFFDEDIAAYLYFLSVFFFVVNLAGIFLLTLPSYELTGYQRSHLREEEKARRVATKAQYLKQRPPMWRFVFGFIVLIVLVIYLPASSAVIAYRSPGRRYELAFGIITTVLTALFLVIAMPLPRALTRRVSWLRAGTSEETPREGKESNACGRGGAEPIEEPRKALPNGETLELAVVAVPDNVSSLSDAEPAASWKGGVAAVSENERLGGEELTLTEAAQQEVVPETEVDYVAPQYQGTFLQNLRTLELWALWWTCFTVIGADYVIMYESSFILGALQGSKPSQSLNALLTVLSGVGSAAGRLVMSAFEVWSQKRKAEDRIPITIALFLPTASSVVTLILFLALPAPALPLPYAIISFGDGFFAALQILITSTLYARDGAKHYHFLFLPTVVGAIVFNRFLYGEWYTVQANKQDRGDNLCFGKVCVLMPLVVLLGLCCSAFGTDTFLHLRYRSYCRTVLEERARLRGEVAKEESVVSVVDLDDGLQEKGEHNGC